MLRAGHSFEASCSRQLYEILVNIKFYGKIVNLNRTQKSYGWNAKRSSMRKKVFKVRIRIPKAYRKKVRHVRR